MRAIQSAQFHTLALFTSITIIISALALKFDAGRALGPSVAATPAALNATQKFTWSMAKRFGPKRNGIVDYHWNPHTRNYEKDYVNPNGWKVDFEACVPGSPPATEYALEINGVEVAKPKSCRFSHEFDKQGSYAVTIKRTSAGTTTSLDGTVTIKDLLIVSLGDSFASGQGNPDIPRNVGTRAKWVDEICARSSKSGPAQAAMQVEADDPHTSVTFLSYACTGAEIQAGILKQQQRRSVAVEPQIEKLDEVLNGRAIDALIISAGGNDLGFADLVVSCIRNNNCGADSPTIDLFTNGLSVLESRYLALSERIAKLPTVKNVFITEYPDLVRNGAGQLCDREPDTDPLRFIRREESKWASEEVIAGLNQKVKEAATRHNWVFVTGISDKFRTHGFCARRGVRWVRTYKDARYVQGADGRCNFSALTARSTIEECLISSGTFHPNEAGHKAYASSLLDALRKAGLITAPGS